MKITNKILTLLVFMGYFFQGNVGHTDEGCPLLFNSQGVVIKNDYSSTPFQLSSGDFFKDEDPRASEWDESPSCQLVDVNPSSILGYHLNCQKKDGQRVGFHCADPLGKNCESDKTILSGHVTV